MKADLTDASVTILLNIDGITHLVTMDKGKYEMLSWLTKASVEKVIPTETTSNELRKFLGVDK